jgi:hypothetical protein
MLNCLPKASKKTVSARAHKMQVNQTVACAASFFLINGIALANEKPSAGKTFEAQCPLVLSGVNITLNERVSDWTPFTSEPIRLKGIIVTTGSDKVTTVIAPSKISRRGSLTTSTLSFSARKSERRQLVCNYSAKKLVLTQPLNDQISSCTVVTQTDETKSFTQAQVTCK